MKPALPRYENQQNHLLTGYQQVRAQLLNLSDPLPKSVDAPMVKIVPNARPPFQISLLHLDTIILHCPVNSSVLLRRNFTQIFSERWLIQTVTSSLPELDPLQINFSYRRYVAGSLFIEILPKECFGQSFLSFPFSALYVAFLL